MVKLKRELKSDKIINIKFMYGKNNLYEKNKVITNYLPRKEKMLKIILNEKKKIVQNYFMRKEKFDTKIKKNLQKFFFCCIILLFEFYTIVSKGYYTSLKISSKLYYLREYYTKIRGVKLGLYMIVPRWFTLFCELLYQKTMV